MSEISTLVYTPGAVKQTMMTQQRTFHFETPCWYSLSRPAERETMVLPDTTGVDDSTLYPSLVHMGFNVTKFCSLPPSTQKRVIETLVHFGAAAPEEILPMLTADLF